MEINNNWSRIFSRNMMETNPSWSKIDRWIFLTIVRSCHFSNNNLTLLHRGIFYLFLLFWTNATRILRLDHISVAESADGNNSFDRHTRERATFSDADDFILVFILYFNMIRYITRVSLFRNNFMELLIEIWTLTLFIETCDII